MKKIRYAIQKKYKSQAGVNITLPPPSQNSHAVRWHCIAEYVNICLPDQTTRCAVWHRSAYGVNEPLETNITTRDIAITRHLSMSALHACVPVMVHLLSRALCNDSLHKLIWTVYVSFHKKSNNSDGRRIKGAVTYTGRVGALLAVTTLRSNFITSICCRFVVSNLLYNKSTANRSNGV